MTQARTGDQTGKKITPPTALAGGINKQQHIHLRGRSTTEMIVRKIAYMQRYAMLRCYCLKASCYIAAVRTEQKNYGSGTQ